MRLREDIRTVSSDTAKLSALTRAFMAAQEDLASSYEIVAGIHGLPLPISCPHHTPSRSFLPWHRKYLLDFEDLLRKHEPDVTLPYWDWGAEPVPATLGGIPEACQPKIVGEVDVNALSSAPMRWVRPFVEANPELLEARPELLALLGGGWSRRDPRPADELHSAQGANLRALEAAALGESDFINFSVGIEQPHDNLHGHVGHHMGAILTAAFDPIFWLHHANVDRQWAVWQRLNKEAEQHPNVEAPLDEVLYPDTKISDMLDIAALGYSYEDMERSPDALKSPERFLRSRGIDPAAPQFRRAERRLVFSGLRMPMDSSLEIRVFKETPRPSVTTPTTGNPNFLGRIFLFGLGVPVHHHAEMVPFQRSLDLTQAGVSNLRELSWLGVTTSGREADLSGVVTAAPTLFGP